MSEADPLLAPGSASIEDFHRLDLRVGRVIDARPLAEARRPAYQMIIDLGPGGTRRSSAQLPPTYPDPGVLVGRLVIVVANLPPRRIAGFWSEVLVLGALPEDGRIPLLGVDPGASPGDRIGWAGVGRRSACGAPSRGEAPSRVWNAWRRVQGAVRGRARYPRGVCGIAVAGSRHEQ